MSALVDFLPAQYRAAVARRRARRQRLLLTVPIVLGLLATDLLFRARLEAIREVARLAQENVDLSRRRAADWQRLTDDTAELTRTLQRWSAPLASHSLLQLLDEVIVLRPAGVTLHEIHGTVDATGIAPPRLQIEASCEAVDDFTGYFAALRRSPALPSLHCGRTDLRADTGTMGFRLETAAAGGSR